MAKKWADPLDRLLEADEKASSVMGYLKPKKMQPEEGFAAIRLNVSSMEIVDVDVNEITRWEYKDRPENELGDIKDLSETFKTIGQQQPCILRPSRDGNKKYELIVGERRWKAAEAAGIPLKAIIKDLDNKKAALIQVIENEKRNDISEFAKGMSFADKIENNLMSTKDIIEILGIKKQQVTRLLSYKKIPQSLFDAIGDFRKVSSRTAYELVRLATKSEQHLQILIKIASKIRDGSYGQKKIEKELEQELSKNTNILKENIKITSHDGRLLFTVKIDANSIPSIHFSKEILSLLNNDILNINEITKNLKECVEQKIGVNDLLLTTKKSPRGDSKSLEYSEKE